MFAYQKTGRYFAQIADGLEEAGAGELESLGASDIKTTFRGIYFSGGHDVLYRVNYMTRLATRVLAPLLTFDCHSDRYLYKTARKMAWDEILSLDTTFAIDANTVNSRIRHSKFAAQRLKDAIVDGFREELGSRPDVEVRDPDVRLNLFIRNNKATISLDTSGGSLHRRGYRASTVEAPMQETVAAAIILFAGWNGEKPLYDPMCGSGTLLCEACMHYCSIPAGHLRERFGFERLPDFDGSLWKRVREDCDSGIRSLPRGLISGSDSSREAVDAALENCGLLPGGGMIPLEVRSFRSIPSLENTVIVCNPPYGVRMKGEEGPATLLGDLGRFLAGRCSGSEAYIYLGRESLLKHIGLRPSWKRPVRTGGLRGCLAKFEIR